MMVAIRKANDLQRALASAARSAINKLITRGRTVTGRRVRELYNIKAGRLKKYTSITRATNSRPRAYINVKGQPIRLHEFAGNQNRRGVPVRIRKDRGRKTVAHAFIATMPSGLIQVWMRQGPKRLPIRPLFTIAPPKMYQYEGKKVFDEMVEQDATKVFKHELDFYFSKIGKK